MVRAILPSATASSTPVTVTVWATFQLALVKVSPAGATVPSVASLELSAMSTSAMGCEVSATVKVAVPPPSPVWPEIRLTWIPALSLSTTLTVSEGAAAPE